MASPVPALQPYPPAQWVFDRMLNLNPGGIAAKIGLRLLQTLRERLISWNDPLVRFDLFGVPMLAPLSHELPFIHRVQPQYSTNVARIASRVCQKYPDLTFIDIGANIGDTVITLRAEARFPILCVEPSERYFAILQRNTQALGDLEFEKCAVSDRETFSGRLLVERGSARLIDDPCIATATKTLDQVVKDHPRFRYARMLKLDTDGFDIAILRGSLDFLAETRAVVFMEYDPHLFLPLKGDGLGLLHELNSSGYETALIYENTGDYLATAELGQRSLLEDIHQFFCGDRGYCDLCLFHRDDAALAWEIRASEIAFFEKQRHLRLLRT